MNVVVTKGIEHSQFICFEQCKQNTTHGLPKGQTCLHRKCDHTTGMDVYMEHAKVNCS